MTDGLDEHAAPNPRPDDRPTISGEILPVWHPTAFTTNRDRLLEGDVAAKFLAAGLRRPRVRQLLSRAHFTVDGTLVEAWASLKSFRPRDDRDEPPGGGRNASRDFHGERRRNDTHASTTDPDARLFRKGHGKEARWRTAMVWWLRPR